MIIFVIIIFVIILSGISVHLKHKERLCSTFTTWLYQSTHREGCDPKYSALLLRNYWFQPINEDLFFRRLL